MIFPLSFVHKVYSHCAYIHCAYHISLNKCLGVHFIHDSVDLALKQGWCLNVANIYMYLLLVLSFLTYWKSNWIEDRNKASVIRGHHICNCV